MAFTAQAGSVALSPHQTMVSDQQVITTELNLPDPLAGPSVVGDSSSMDADPITWRLSKSTIRRRKPWTAAKIILKTSTTSQTTSVNSTEPEVAPQGSASKAEV